MTRAYVPQSKYCPYHITARCINKEWFCIPLSDVWTIMESYLYFISKSYGIIIHSFVLMPNHFHLIVSQPNGNLSEAMNYFMRETSRLINRLAGRINQTYGGRFHRSLISSEIYFHHAYKYIYRNPVRANLCEKVEDYQYSSLGGLLGLRRIHIPLAEDTILFKGDNLDLQTIEWLNRTPPSKSEKEIQRALRRKIYELPKDKNTKKPSSLENILFY